LRKGNGITGGGNSGVDMLSVCLDLVPAPAWLIRLRPVPQVVRANGSGLRRLEVDASYLEPALFAIASGLHLPRQFTGGPLLTHGEEAWFLVAEDGRPRGTLEHRLMHEFMLTAKQCEVALLVVDGKQNKEIAKRLGTSVRTVEVHVSTILRKCSAATRSELISLLLRSSGA